MYKSNIFSKRYSNESHNDFDSENTKESEKKSYSSKSSSYSSITDNKNDKFEYPNIMKTQNILNNLSNNLSYQSMEEIIIEIFQILKVFFFLKNQGLTL